MHLQARQYYGDYYGDDRYVLSRFIVLFVRVAVLVVRLFATVDVTMSLGLRINRHLSIRVQQSPSFVFGRAVPPFSTNNLS